MLRLVAARPWQGRRRSVEVGRHHGHAAAQKSTSDQATAAENAQGNGLADIDV
jgi:hypothetical protein